MTTRPPTFSALRYDQLDGQLRNLIKENEKLIRELSGCLEYLKNKECVLVGALMAARNAAALTKTRIETLKHETSTQRHHLLRR